MTTTGEATADITAKALTVSGAVAENKVYDGTAVATITGAELDGVVGDDDVSLDSLTGSFAQSGVGEGIAVTASLTLTGEDAGNYSLTQPEGLTADITVRDLVLSNFTADSKDYDGTTDVSGVGFDDDRLEGDELEFTFDAAFADASVGEGKTVAVTDIAISGGSDQGNYTLVTTTGEATADITAKALTVSGAVAENKVYDGTAVATITGAELNGVVGDDDVSLDSLTGSFAQSTVGEGIAVTSSLTLTGEDAGNYSLTQPEGLTADITARDLTLDEFVADSKTYDGTTDVTGVDFTDNRVAGDELEFEFDAAFEDASVGEGKAVLISDIRLTGGADQGNYTLLTTTGEASAAILAGEPAGIVIAGPDRVTANAISEEFSITVVDAHLNPTAVDTDTTFALSTTSEGNTRFNPHLNFVLPIQIVAGASTVTFTYRDTEAGIQAITAVFDDGDSLLAEVMAKHEIEVEAGEPKQILLSGPNVVQAGTISDVFTLTVVDAYLNPAAVDADTEFVLDSTSGGTIRFNAHLNFVVPIAIQQGASSVTFTYRDLEPGLKTLSAMVAGGDDRLAGQVVEIDCMVVTDAWEKVLDYAASDGVTDAPGLQDFAALGIEVLTEEFLALLNEAIAGAQSDQVNTLAKLGAIFESIKADRPYAWWAAVHGVETAPDESSANDFHTNLLRYALGVDPRSPIPSSALPAMDLTEYEGSSRLTLTVERNPDATDIVFRAEVSSDLKTWHSGDEHIGILEESPGRIVFFDRIPIEENRFRMIRLRVLLPGNGND